MNRSNYPALLGFRTYTDLVSEASRTYLSFFWWLAEPAFQLAIYYLVFGLLLGIRTENFLAFLLTGIIAWQLFNRLIMNASASITRGVGIYSKVPINKLFFPTVALLSDLIKHLVVLLVLLGFLLLTGYSLGVALVSLPLVVLTEVILAAAIGYWAALLVPFVPDLSIVIATILMGLMFASGIFYDVSNLSPEIQSVFYLNPMAVLIREHRSVLLSNQFPEWQALGIIALVSAVLIFAAARFERRFSQHYIRLVVS